MEENQENATPEADPVEKLRKQLRDGRTSKASRTPGGNITPFDRAKRDGVSAVHRESSGVEPAHTGDSDPQGSSDQKSLRVGRGSGRPGTRNSRAARIAEADGSTVGRAAGQLVAEDEIPPRIEITEKRTFRPQGNKQPSETVPGKAKPSVLNVFKGGKTLSKHEVEAYREPFEAALRDAFKYGDQGIWYRTQDATQSPVWSNADDDEIGVLVKVLLSKGETSPLAASIVRNAVSAHDYVSVALILGPRAIITADRLAKAPKREKKKRGQA